VGISILIAHLLASPPSPWKQTLLDGKLFVGISMVPLGFILGNPFAVLDYSAFVSDFMYNLSVAPVYEGITSGHSYLTFFSRVIELIGLPAFAVFSILIAFCLYFLLKGKMDSGERKAYGLLFSVFALYYLYIGSYPRLPTRFALPVVPIWMMLAGPVLRVRPRFRFLAAGMGAAILAYNVVCSAFIGERFLNDPRMQAQTWVQQNVPNGILFEYSSYSPVWNRLPGVSVNKRKMPFISGRSRLFEEVLEEDIWAMSSLEEVEKGGEKPLQWYTLDQLMVRNPDYIAVDSLYYSRFMGNPYYPSIEEFFVQLMNEQYPYEIVFDQETGQVPGWLYPKEIDFLTNRITIFERR
jgi:hypothetical protein